MGFRHGVHRYCSRCVHLQSGRGSETFKEEWQALGVRAEGWLWYTSPKGWTDDFLGQNGSLAPFSHRRFLMIPICDVSLSSTVKGAMSMSNHSSHVTQPLEVGMFRPLKQAIALTTDRVARFDEGRMSRATWVSNIIVAPQRTLTSSNIKSGWRLSGLHPFNPKKLLANPSASPSNPLSQPIVSRTPLR